MLYRTAAQSCTDGSVSGLDDIVFDTNSSTIKLVVACGV